MESPNLHHVTAEEFSLPKINQNIQEDTNFEGGEKTFTKKNVATKIFNKDDMKLLKTYDMRLKKNEIPDSEPVFIYGGQKNNYYEKQMRELREKVKNDKGKYIYTYSNDHLGLSIDPQNLDEEAKK